MKKILIVICLMIGIGIVCEFGFNSYNPYETKCVEAGCNNDRVEGSIYCKEHKPSEKDTTEETTKETTTYSYHNSSSSSSYSNSSSSYGGSSSYSNSSSSYGGSSSYSSSTKKKAVHQLVGILHIVVVVIQVLHINLMMRDTRLYMMTTTMIGTDIIAIQTMLKV